VVFKDSRELKIYGDPLEGKDILELFIFKVLGC
jgi:hypothetical protein